MEPFGEPRDVFHRALFLETKTNHFKLPPKSPQSRI
jgi:hypothetical protein